MTEIILEIKGPFALLGPNSFFKATKNELSGLYIFTFKPDKKYLIQYLGITMRSFKARFKEHIRELLSGGYRLYDFSKLKNNEPSISLWSGRYGKDKEDIANFLDDYLHYSSIIKQQLQEFSIFLIPIKTDRRTLERIEGSIYQFLRKQNNEPTVSFIKGIISRPRREKEDPIIVKIKSNDLLSQIPNNFEI